MLEMQVNPVEPGGIKSCIRLSFNTFTCGDTHSLLHAKHPDITHVSYITLVISKPDRTASTFLCNRDVEELFF